MADMQSMNHQMMGYDRAITMFSPDGRLLQVEYAKKTVKQGSTAIGMVCKDGVLLVTDKRIVDPLVVPESVEKIFQVDEHVGATASGILSDARVLIERSQVKAQQYRVTYDSPIDTATVVKDVCSLKQLCTQSGGLRPFGVSLLIAGIDLDGPHLFETDPTGIFFEYKASVIGEAETEVEEFLHKNYFVTRLNNQVGMNLEQVGKCDDVIWNNFTPGEQAKYYPFMDNLHTVMNIKRVPYTEKDIQEAITNQGLQELDITERLTLGMVEARNGTLYSVNPKLTSRDYVHSPEIGEELTFPQELERQYKQSLEVRICTQE